jgi:hypothetical protein
MRRRWQRNRNRSGSESLSLTTERRRQAVERAFEQLAEHQPVLAIQA